jgi:hypothetical protein
MESLNVISTILETASPSLSTLTSTINKDTIENVDKYFLKLEQDLKKQKQQLQCEIQNEINKGIEMEYEIPRHQLIDSTVPYIQMIKELYTERNLINTYSNTCYSRNYSQMSIDIYLQYFHTHKNLRLFGVPVILTKNEYVVYILFKFKNNIIHDNMDMLYVDIIYITNYGRFITKTFCLSSNKITCADIITDRIQVIGDNGLFEEFNFNEYGQSCSNKTYTFSEITQTTLPYRLPTIFIKIFNAIYKEDTNLLQKCCKEYHDRYMDNKKLKEENKNILESIKNPYETMKPKYEKLLTENEELKKDNASLKMELELMKIKMEEIRKMYMQ